MSSPPCVVGPVVRAGPPDRDSSGPGSSAPRPDLGGNRTTSADVQVRQLNEAVWQVEQPLTAEVPLLLHVVIGAEGVALIDAGVPESYNAVAEMLSAAEVTPRQLRYLLVTHAHHDHIGLLARLRDETGALVVAPAGAVPWIEDVERNLREFALHRVDLIPDTPELRAELEPTYDRGAHVDLTVEEGSTVRLGGGVVLRALSVPGHLLAEIGWFEERTRTLILGDPVSGTTWPLFPGHLSPSDLRRTLRKLRAFAVDERVELVCMAHYGVHGRDDFIALVDEVDDWLDRIWAVIRQALGTTPRSLREVWTDTCAAMGKAREFRSLAMVEAHLRELVTSGEVRLVGPDLYAAANSRARPAPDV